MTYDWLSPDYRPPRCQGCSGRDSACLTCGGEGQGMPVFTRTDAIRSAQKAVGHAPCFGAAGKRWSGRPNDAMTPQNCGEGSCPYRPACVALHLPNPFNAERMREESVEHLSRLFLNARAIEGPTQQWSPFQAELAAHVQQWTDDTPQVAVIGAFSAGKSTFLNRLVGRALLPVTRPPTTAVVTSIQFGERTCGIIEHRRRVRVTLVSQDARSPDPAAIEAMRIWMRAPEEYGVTAIREVDDRDQHVEVDRGELLRELDAIAHLQPSWRATATAGAQRIAAEALRRIIPRRPRAPMDRINRTFEVIFREQPHTEFPLQNDDQAREFGRHLTEPALALSLQRATCFLPNPRLQSLSFLDTAGLCSPVGFHKDVTTELLNRRPDKILVLLDARRLDSPTNGEALKALGRFVSVPDDYRQVTFGLTFWDLALRNHMLEDSESEIDYRSEYARSAASKAFARSKRRDLVKLLASWVGVRCQVTPPVFTLGLGQGAPPEMLPSVGDLWHHLDRDCRGWAGVEMWAERWRAGRGYVDRLLQLHAETRADTETTMQDRRDITDLNAEMNRLGSMLENIEVALQRAEQSLQAVVAAQRERMLTEIRGLDGKSALLRYLETGYWDSANTALDVLQKESERHNAFLAELYREARAIHAISLDRKLLGLDTVARDRATGEVSGMLYGLKAAWDFLFGSLGELTEGNRAAARNILSEQARGTIDILDDALLRWSGQAQRVQQQAKADDAELRESIRARRTDKQQYLDALARKLRFLNDFEPPLRQACAQIEAFTETLAEAHTRLAASRRPDFRAALFTDQGDAVFRKGREQDLLLLLDLDSGLWKRLEIRAGGSFREFVPMAVGDGRSVVFTASADDPDRSRLPVRVPDGATHFALRLSTLEGEFRFTSRRSAPAAGGQRSRRTR
jgi:hypothetical protein